MIIIKRLNIFIDESGDFGFSKGSSKLYAVSFTLHESADSIKNELAYLNEKLNKLNYDGMIHLVSGQQKDVLKPSKMRCKIKTSKF